MAKTYYADKTPKISKLYTDEIFKDVEGFNGNLKISNYGRAWENEKITFSGKNHRIKKVIPARILKLQDNGVGYLQVVTKINGKLFRKYIHRLVALYFCENTENKPFVNHKDENPKNNKHTNLEWVTHKENINWGTCKNKIGVSRQKYVGPLSGVYKTQEYYKTKKISRSNFKKICKNKNWDINNFEEIFSGEIYSKNGDKLYYYVFKE